MLGFVSDAGISSLAVLADAGNFELTPGQLLWQRILEGFTILWVVCVGSIVGSFLNVVVYRLPRGMSLRRPPSRCSSCGAPVARRDNVPILGWWLLRGRCRHCRAPIPLRYPLVEAAVAALTLALLVGELLRGGANLPVRIPNRTHGNPILWILWYTKWDILGICLYHGLLLTALLAVALIAWDGFRPPRRLVWPVLAVGMLPPILWPTLHPAPCLLPRPEWLSAIRWELTWRDSYFTPGWPLRLGVGLEGGVDGLAGAALGGIVGWAATWRQGAPAATAALRFGWLWVGLFLGWQACLSAALAYTAVGAGMRGVARGCGLKLSPAAGPLLLWGVAVAQVLAWKHLDSLPVWVGEQGISGWPWPRCASWSAAVVGVVLTVGLLPGLADESPPNTLTYKMQIHKRRL